MLVYILIFSNYYQTFLFGGWDTRTHNDQIILSEVFQFVAVNLYKPSNAFLKHSCLTQLIIRMLVLFQVTCKLIIIVQ